MYELVLNLIPQGILPRLNVSQYDHGQTVDVTLYEGSTAYTLPSGATVTVSGTKADNTGFEYNCTTTDGLSFTIADQMTVFAGEVECELTIRYGNNRISTINFILDVEKAALQDDVVISETDLPIIQQLPEKLAEAKAYANKAHQWATYGGDSETPSATNNAKYWAQQAAQTDIGRAIAVDYSTDKTPYQFRRCTHNAVYDKLVGISYAKNQLVQNGNFANGTTGWSSTRSTMSASNGVLTATCTTAGFVTLLTSDAYSFYDLVGRAVLVRLQMKASAIRGTASVALNANTINSNYYRIPAGSLTANTWYNVDVVIKPSETLATGLRVGMDSMQVGDTISIQNVNVIDLTVMFSNPAIADKIYTMEQVEAGSGLAWIRQYGFLNDAYIEYNAGAIESSAPTYRKVVGKNQWDEIAENGYFNPTTGVPMSGDNYIRSKNYISVMDNQSYYFYNGGVNVFAKFVCYDKDKNVIDVIGSIKNTSVFTVPSGTRYMRFYMDTGYGRVYNHDICINISDPTKNGTYEPYKEVTYPLGGDTLRGVPQLVGDDLVADGDIKTSDGVVNGRYLEPINLGSKDWTYTADNRITAGGCFLTTIANKKSRSTNMVCSKYPTSTVLGLTNIISTYGVGVDKLVFVTDSDSQNIYVIDSAYTDAATFKSAMNGVYLVCEKATPTSSVSTPFTSPQVSLETEETDTICGHDSVVVDIPEWMQNEYFDDVRADASKVQGIEQFLDIKVEDKTTIGAYARFKRCGNHVEVSLNGYNVTNGESGIEVPEQFRTSVYEYGYAFAGSGSNVVGVTYDKTGNKLTFRDVALRNYVTGIMYGGISWYIE